MQQFYKNNVKLDHALKRTVPRELVYCAYKGEPFSNAVITDYGLNSECHENEVREAILSKKISPEFWEKSCGDGVAMTDIMKERMNSTLVYATAWDYIERRRTGEEDPCLQQKKKEVLKNLFSGKNSAFKPVKSTSASYDDTDK
jgi:hypothetical protein